MTLRNVTRSIILQEIEDEGLNNMIHLIMKRLYDIRFWKEIVLQLLHGQLDPRLMSLQQLQKEIREAKAKGYRLLDTDLANFYKSPVSYLPNETHIDIFIHVPIVKDEFLSCCTVHSQFL